MYEFSAEEPMTTTIGMRYDFVFHDRPKLGCNRLDLGAVPRRRDYLMKADSVNGISIKHLAMHVPENAKSSLAAAALMILTAAWESIIVIVLAFLKAEVQA